MNAYGAYHIASAGWDPTGQQVPNTPREIEYELRYGTAPTVPSTPNLDRVLSALSAAFAPHENYMYYSDYGNGGLKSLRSKLRGAAKELGEGNIRQDDDYLYELNDAAAAYQPGLNRLTIPSGDLEPLDAVHELLHAYVDLDNWLTYISERKDEGIAYAGMYMVRNMRRRLHKVEDMMNAGSSDYLRLRSEWHASWWIINSTIGESVVANNRSSDVNEHDVRNVERYVGFNVRCSRIADIYNETQYAQDHNVVFVCQKGYNHSSDPIKIDDQGRCEMSLRKDIHEVFQ
jgi:hypothetical protein